MITHIGRVKKFCDSLVGCHILGGGEKNLKNSCLNYIKKWQRKQRKQQKRKRRRGINLLTAPTGYVGAVFICLFMISYFVV